jgi:hypothetical protein
MTLELWGPIFVLLIIGTIAINIAKPVGEVRSTRSMIATACGMVLLLATGYFFYRGYPEILLFGKNDPLLIAQSNYYQCMYKGTLTLPKSPFGDFVCPLNGNLEFLVFFSIFLLFLGIYFSRKDGIIQE